MRKIDLSAITTTNGLPAKSGVWRHLQLAYQEAFAALANSLINGSTSPYILYGCNVSNSGTSYTVSAGAVYIGGEIYLVDSATFTVSGSNIIIGTITTTSYTGSDADPITFTDGTPRSVLNIRKVVFSAGVTGSGDVDYSALTNLNTFNVYSPSFTSTYQTINNATILYFVRFGCVTISVSLNYTPSGTHPLLITFPAPIAVNNFFSSYGAALPGAGAVIEGTSSQIAAKLSINGSLNIQLSTVGNVSGASTFYAQLTYPI